MQPKLSDIPSGWHVLSGGKTRSGDKYWWESRQAWLPVGHDDWTCCVEVRLEDMPLVIRKG
jgi:hypothetical protein